MKPISIFVARAANCYGIGWSAQQAIDAMLDVNHSLELPDEYDEPQDYFDGAVETREKRAKLMTKLIEKGSLVRFDGVTALAVNQFGDVEYQPADAKTVKLVADPLDEDESPLNAFFREVT